jgi:hypothetical protein
MKSFLSLLDAFKVNIKSDGFAFSWNCGLSTLLWQMTVYVFSIIFLVAQLQRGFCFY